MKKNGTRSGAEALTESLEKAGTEVVFGYPGANVLDVFDCLRDARFRFVLGRHEQGCVHMADGYARASGRPGVVIVTSGPGLTNTITGLGCANMDGVPLVLICGQVDLGRIGTDAFQEADTTGLTRAVSKHNFLVKSADEIPETVAQAFYIATHGKPGPVVIDLPRDIQEQLTSARYPERISLRAYHPECAPDPKDVALLAKWLNAARRPVIYAGGGVIAADAAKDLVRLAHKAEIPVATTLMGIGAIDEADPLALGMAGVYGTATARKALETADFILALGVRFNDRVTDGAKPRRGARIVHVDCDPASIDKNVRVSLGIVADVKDLLTVVASRVRAAGRSGWLKELGLPKALPPYRSGGADAVMPQAVIDAITKATKGHCLLATDVGQHQMFAARRFPHAHPRHFITSGGMGAMGFGIPAAIGAAIARPDHKVVAVLGDGGAQMTAEELAVAVQLGLPIAFVVLNNRSLGMIAQMQRHPWSGGYTTPDFVALAKAYGLKSFRVDSPARLDAGIARAVRMKSPVLVEVSVDPRATLP